MRRPPFSSLLAPLATMCAAAALVAAPAGAQSSFALRRGFERAITPFIGATGFGARTTGVATQNGAPGDFGYNNGLALGAQADLPLTRRTAVMATLAITPVSHVTLTYGTGGVASLDRTMLAGLDVGLAGRLKPGAPLFAYVGGGGLLATHRAAGEGAGAGVDPRASAGLGVDFGRHTRSGVRLMYLAHLAFPTTPDAAQFPARSSAFDFTVFLGGRFTFGPDSGDRK